MFSSFIQRIFSVLISVNQLLLDLIFPPLCITCRARLKDENKKIFLCDECKNKIKINNSLFCSECNRRIPFNQMDSTHPTCHNSAFFLIASASYENEVVKELIHKLKYDGLKTAIIPINELIIKPYLQSLFVNWKLEISNCAIAPIPLHKSKERKRGFNQSELIARALSENINGSPTSQTLPQLQEVGLPKIEQKPINLVNLLIRAKKTKSQAELHSKENRALNISGCFEVNKSAFISAFSQNNPRLYPRIIVVDDVFTSGATMKEAVYILKETGAKKILGFVIAKT